MSLRISLCEASSSQGQFVLARLLGRAERVLDRTVESGAIRLVRQVRRGGDAALLEAVRRLDGAGAVPEGATRADGLRLVVASADEEARSLPAKLLSALDEAIDAVTAFYRPQLPEPVFRLERSGLVLEEVRTPLARVGLYVPGGRAVYPSTVIMSAVPARLAGVTEIVVATPPAAFRQAAALRYVLARLEVDEIWGMGGAHAVAALAYGTETIRRVDKICGPGNAWVTAAKRFVAGDVGIDSLAGPTEVLILADAGANPAWVAADLLAQAEHDPHAAAVLLTSSRELGEAVLVELERQLPSLATAATAREALEGSGAILLVAGAEEALELAEAIAPEHLQLVGPEVEALAPRVRSAGAVFVGASSAEVFGDYLAGPSHVLPTCGSARFTSALGVEDFQRRSHRIRVEPAAAARLAEATALLAEAEGLPAHRAAALARLP